MTKIELNSLGKKQAEDEALFVAGGVGDEDGLAGDDSDDNAGVTPDDASHTRLLNDLIKLNKNKRNEAKPTARKPLGGAADRLGTSHFYSLLETRGTKENASKLKTVPTPTEKVIAKKAKRAAGYEDVMIESEKWASIVHRQRRADNLSFPLHPPDLRPVEVKRNEEREWKPKTKLEEDVYGLLQGAKLVEKKVETAEEQAIKRAMSLQEIREKNRELWRQRELRRRYEEKAMRQNKSKSRKHHRILRREKLKKQRAEIEELQQKDPEAALGVLEELERVRIEERMTLRHKKSKWAHLQGPRAQRDKQVMAALKENQRMHRELITKQARKDDSDEDEESTKKIEEMLKEREIAREEGTYDPLNPWTNNLTRFPKASIRGLEQEEEEGKESFTRFVKFWDDFNKRKAFDKKIQEEMERREEEESRASLRKEREEKEEKGERLEEEEVDEGEEEEEVEEEGMDEEEEEEAEEEEEESSKNININKEKENQEKKGKNEKGRRAEGNISEQDSTKEAGTKDHIEDSNLEEKSKEMKPKKKRKKGKKGSSGQDITSILDNKLEENSTETVTTKRKGKNVLIQGNTNQGNLKKENLTPKQKKGKGKNTNLKDQGSEESSLKNENNKKKGIKRKNSIRAQSNTNSEEKCVEEVVEEYTSAKKAKKLDKNDDESKKRAIVKQEKKLKSNEDSSVMKGKCAEKTEEKSAIKKGKKKHTEEKRDESVKGQKKGKNTKQGTEKSEDDNGKKRGKTGDKKASPLGNINPKEKKNEVKKKIEVDSNPSVEEEPYNLGEDAATSIDMLFDEAEEGLKTVVKRKLQKLSTLETEEEQKWMQAKKLKKRPSKNDRSTLPVEEFDFTVTDDSEKINERLERTAPLNDEASVDGKKVLEKAVSVLKQDAQDNKSEEMQSQGGKDSRYSSQSDKDSAKSTKSVNVDPTKFMQVNAKRLVTAMPDVIVGGGEEALDDEEEDEEHGEEDPEAVIREAFADDYLIEEFNAEKKAAIERDNPKTMTLALPGWGEWTGPNIVMSNRKRKKFNRGKAPQNIRKDTNVSNVIYNEKADLHDNLRKAMVSDLPYPFKSVKDFEASVRAPVGRLFLPDAAHRSMTRPPVTTKLGKVIEPMSEESLLKKKDSLKEKRARKIKEEKTMKNKEKGRVGRGKKGGERGRGGLKR